MKIRTTITAGVILVLIIGFIVVLSVQSGGTSSHAPAVTTKDVGSSTPTTTSSATTYTLAQVATHANGTSCWTAINGGVYDVTSWINQHPGGPGAILSICGKDGSAAFNGQHGGQARPASELAGFKIGALAK